MSLKDTLAQATVDDHPVVRKLCAVSAIGQTGWIE